MFDAVGTDEGTPNPATKGQRQSMIMGFQASAEKATLTEGQIDQPLQIENPKSLHHHEQTLLPFSLHGKELFVNTQGY